MKFFGSLLRRTSPKRLYHYTSPVGPRGIFYDREIWPSGKGNFAKCWWDRKDATKGWKHFGPSRSNGTTNPRGSKITPCITGQVTAPTHRVLCSRFPPSPKPSPSNASDRLLYPIGGSGSPKGGNDFKYFQPQRTPRFLLSRRANEERIRYFLTRETNRNTRRKRGKWYFGTRSGGEGGQSAKEMDVIHG
jgi:hypothetical protein